MPLTAAPGDYWATAADPSGPKRKGPVRSTASDRPFSVPRLDIIDEVSYVGVFQVYPNIIWASTYSHRKPVEHLGYLEVGVFCPTAVATGYESFTGLPTIKIEVHSAQGLEATVIVDLATWGNLPAGRRIIDVVAQTFNGDGATAYVTIVDLGIPVADREYWATAIEVENVGNEQFDQHDSRFYQGGPLIARPLT
jgi:hypothetical protein